MTGAVMPVKWAFDLQKQDYNVFDSSIKTGTTWSYQGEETVFGVPTYVYTNEVPPTMVDTLEIPTSAIPGEDKDAEGSTVLDEMYSSKSTYWMEPVTGQIIQGESSEFTTYDLDGEQKLVKADYTGKSGNQESADDAAALAGLVTMIGTTLPLVFAILGIVLIVIGLLLSRGGDKKDGDAAAPAQGATASV